MIKPLIFPGYNSFPAPSTDVAWGKWLALKDQLNSVMFASLGFNLNGLDLQSIAKFNQQINSFIKYRSEPPGINVWQTPAETIKSRAGDCKDYATLKYSILLQSGMSHDKLCISLGQIKSISGNLDHAWLAAFAEDNWRVLDSKFDQLITPADYLNWLPLAALWADQAVLFGPQVEI